MNCGYKEKIILYFYGELPSAAAAEVKAHAAACASCAEALSTLKSLSEDFDAFTPQAPALNAEELVLAPFADPPMERFWAGLGRSALACVFTALFLLMFQTAGFRNGSSAWRTDIDSGLDLVEYDIYSLREDMSYLAVSDFDYKCVDLEARKEQAV
jgi:predicted anti-sigma-YlaC factor YlaD